MLRRRRTMAEVAQTLLWLLVGWSTLIQLLLLRLLRRRRHLLVVVILPLLLIGLLWVELLLLLHLLDLMLHDHPLSVKLHASHPLDGLVPLYPLLLPCLQDLLVLDPQLPSLYLKAVERGDAGIRLLGCVEVCECEAPEDSVVVVVVERIRRCQREIIDDLEERGRGERKGYVLDDDGRRDDVVCPCARSSCSAGVRWRLMQIRKRPLTVRLWMQVRRRLM